MTWIKEFRLKQGWTQAQLAEAIRTSPSSISFWERGLRPVEEPFLSRLKALIDPPPPPPTAPDPTPPSVEAPTRRGRAAAAASRPPPPPSPDDLSATPPKRRGRPSKYQPSLDALKQALDDLRSSALPPQPPPSPQPPPPQPPALPKPTAKPKRAPAPPPPKTNPFQRWRAFSRDYRAAHNLTPEQLSDRINAFPHVIHAFERGNRYYGASFAHALAFTCLKADAVHASRHLMREDDAKLKFNRFLKETIQDDDNWPDPHTLVPAFIDTITPKKAEPEPRPSKPPPAPPLPPPPPPARAVVAPKPATTSPKPATTPPRTQKASSAAKPAPAKAPANAPTKPAAPAANAPAPLPPLPPMPLSLQVNAPQPPLETVLSAHPPKSLDLAALELAVMGWRLLLREQFDELLCLNQLKHLKRLDYQIETVSKVLRRFRGRAMLSDEVGLGKTIEAGMIILEFTLRSLTQQTLILAPAALVGQWRDELAEKFNIHAQTTQDPTFRTDPERAWAGRDLPPPRVVIASLQLARHKQHAHHVQSQRWDLVVVDEAHHIKNRDTAGYKLIDTLRSRFLLLLTATPVENSLEELYNLVTLLKPGQLSTVSAFKRAFVDPDDPFSPRNRERLRDLLSEVMIRNTRALAGLGVMLPPRFAQTVSIPPTPPEATLYDALLQTIRALRDRRAASTTPQSGKQRMALRLLLEQAGSSVFALRASLHRRAQRASLDPDAPDLDLLPATTRASLTSLSDAACAQPPSKLAHLVALLRGLKPDDKALIFTKYVASLSAIEDALEDAGIPCALFHGQMSAQQKDDAVERFRDALPVLVATEVGGEGRNMQFANVLINFDLPWNPMKIEQRIGRLHRIGQTREVHIYNLCALGSAEEQILTVLGGRIQLFELVVGEVDMILGKALEDEAFEERVFQIYEASADAAQVVAGFEVLADELASARQQYDSVKALDAALFGRDFEA